MSIQSELQVMLKGLTRSAAESALEWASVTRLANAPRPALPESATPEDREVVRAARQAETDRAAEQARLRSAVTDKFENQIIGFVLALEAELAEARG